MKGPIVRERVAQANGDVAAWHERGREAYHILPNPKGGRIRTLMTDEESEP